MAAQSEAIDRRHEYLCVEHILYALLHNDAGVNVIRSCGGDTNIIKQDLEDFFSQQEEVDENKLPRQTRSVQRVLHLAMMHVHNNGIGVCGSYSYEVAETKVETVHGLAEQYEFPLLATMEEN